MSEQLKRELVIQPTDAGCDIALLENKELVEFHRDSKKNAINVGDIYWARIKKIMPPLNAAFVDIGEGKDAFLHYSDLGEHFSSFQFFFDKLQTSSNFKIEKSPSIPSFPKDGKIADVLKVNDYVAVQILKEPMGTKGARLTADISLAGRYIVLTPFNSQINISKKITDSDERPKLKKVMSGLTTKNMGVIIRTVAKGKTLNDLHQDYLELVAVWNTLSKRINKAKAIRSKLFEEQSKSNTLLRDILNDSFTKIHVQGEELSLSMKKYIEKIAPTKTKIVKTYKKDSIFETLDLTSKIKSAFNRIIPLSSGGYIIMEQTEALFVVDVNSGVHKAKKDKLDIDESILKTNLDAAKEIARQLRLRDIGGIIVIDFIDAKNPESKNVLYEQMIEYMRNDKASHSILPLSKFCLMQITRSRTRPQEKVKTKEVCPSCDGSGKISNVVFLTDFIYNKLIYVLKEHKNITLTVHPYVHAFLTKGVISKFTKWQWRLKTLIQLKKSSSVGIVEYYFSKASGEKIKL